MYVHDMTAAQGLVGNCYSHGGGATLRVAATEQRRIRVVEQNNDGVVRYRNRVLPLGTHVVPSAFKRAECAEVCVFDVGPA
jgi:hypothetical protein